MLVTFFEQSHTEQLRAFARQRAFDLARSGRHEDSTSIELALKVAGYPGAGDSLDDATRAQLDRLCFEARRSSRSVYHAKMHALLEASEYAEGAFA